MRFLLITASLLAVPAFAQQSAPATSGIVARTWDKPPRQSPLPSNPTYLHAVAHGCVIGQYPKEWWDQKVKSVKWDGRCKPNNKADSGKLVVTLHDGRTETLEGKFSFYAGLMKGRYQQADGYIYEGLFNDGDFNFGTITRPDGSVAYKGSVNQGWYTHGTVFFQDGATLLGSLDSLVAVDPLTGLQVLFGTVYRADKSVERYIVASQTATEAQHKAAIVALTSQLQTNVKMLDQLTEKIRAENKAREAEEEARRKSEPPKTGGLGLLGAAINAAVGASGGAAERLAAANAAVNPDARVGQDVANAIRASASSSGSGSASAGSTSGSADVPRTTGGSPEESLEFPVASAKNCVQLIKIPNKMALYDLYRLENSCGFQVGAVYHCYEGDKLVDWCVGGVVAAGSHIETDHPKRENQKVVLAWACPSKAEVQRRMGSRKVASVHGSVEKGCYGMFESAPVGVAH